MVRSVTLILLAALAALIPLGVTPSRRPIRGDSPGLAPAPVHGKRWVDAGAHAEPGRIHEAHLALRCIDADSREPVPLVQVDVDGAPRSFLTDRHGGVTFPLARGLQRVELQHPLYRSVAVEFEIRGNAHRDVELSKLGCEDFVEFEGSITCTEDLMRAPEVRVAVPRVMRQGEHIEGGHRILSLSAHVQQVRLPVRETGPGSWRFSARLSPYQEHTFMVVGLLPPVDQRGFYLGDVAYVALKVLRGDELRGLGEGTLSLQEQFHLERDSRVVALDIGDDSGRPLGARNDLCVALACDSPLAPGLNYDLVLRPAGHSLEVFGLPELMRLQVQASGFAACILPRHGRGLDDRIDVPACLTIRLKQESQPSGDAVVETVVESDADEAPLLKIIDLKTGESTSRHFTRAAGSLWQVRMRNRSGGPMDLFVLMQDRSVFVSPLWLQTGINRLDLPEPRGAVVSGLVTRRGVPLPGMEVTWLHGSARVRQVETDAAGRFVMPGVTRFPFTLEVADPEFGCLETFRIARSGEIGLEMPDP